MENQVEVSAPVVATPQINVEEVYVLAKEHRTDKNGRRYAYLTIGPAAKQYLYHPDGSVKMNPVTGQPQFKRNDVDANSTAILAWEKDYLKIYQAEQKLDKPYEEFTPEEKASVGAGLFFDAEIGEQLSGNIVTMPVAPYSIKNTRNGETFVTQTNRFKTFVSGEFPTEELLITACKKAAQARQQVYDSSQVAVISAYDREDAPVSQSAVEQTNGTLNLPNS